MLGAETPRQDLGLVYSKSAAGEESYMYSSVAGGGNTYVPGEVQKNSNDEDYDSELWNHEDVQSVQEHGSHGTSLSQIPATHKLVDKIGGWKEGSVNADIGGGRYDHFTDAMRDMHGVSNYVYDPFNRDDKHNSKVASIVSNGRSDTATVNNVLNVIKEPEIREQVIRQAANAIKGTGSAYFLIHEGNRTGEGGVTKKGWQENRPAKSYLDEIAKHFGDVKRKGNLIIARKESESLSRNSKGGIAMEYAKDEDGQEPEKNWAQIAAALAPVAGELIGGMMGGGDKNAKRTGPRPIRKPRAKGFKFDKDEMPEDVPGQDDVLDGDDEMALDQQSVQQIVEGLKPTIIDIVQEEIASIVGDQGMGPEDMLEDQEVEVVPDEEVEDMLDEEPEEEVMAEEPEAEEGEEDEEEEVERNSKEEYAKELFAKMAEKHNLYGKDADYKSASQYMASMEDADRNAMEQYMCGGKPSKEEKDAYSKCAECDKAMKDNYSKSSEVAQVDKYRKQLDEQSEKFSKLQQQYSKLQSELVEAKDQLTEVRRSEKFHKIADRLANLEAEGYSFDKEKELEFCMQLSDELREDHLAVRIPQQYAKCPVGAPIPVEESEELKPIEQKSIKYSRAANLATQKLRAQGHKGVSFDKVLKHMCDNDTDECPSVEDLK